MALRVRPSPYALSTDPFFRDLVQRLMGGRVEEGPRRARGVEGEGNVTWMPTIDVFSRDDDLVIRAELPGIDPKRDVDISVRDGTLVIRGERKYEQRTEQADRYLTEIFYGSFLRTVPLPDGVKASDIKARYDNGILEVVVPKAAQLSPSTKVPISTSSADRQLSGESAETSSQAQPSSQEKGATHEERPRSEA